MISAQVRRCAAAFSIFLSVTSAARARNAPSDLAYNRHYAVYQSSAAPFQLRLFAWRQLDAMQPVGRPLPPPPAPFAVTASSGPTPALAVIGRKYGGLARRSDGAAVLIAPDALAQDSPLIISSATYGGRAELLAQAAAQAAQGLRAVSDAAAFGPAGLTLSIPATITLPYDPAAISGRRSAAVKIYAWDPAAASWTPLPSTMDASAHTVSASAWRLTTCQALADGSAAGAAASVGVVRPPVDETFEFHEVFVSPNATPGGSATFRVQAGPADGVELRLYARGLPLGAPIAMTSQGVVDVGNGQGPRLTYGYVWRVPPEAGAVYDFVVIARKAARMSIVRSGRLAVAR